MAGRSRKNSARRGDVRSAVQRSSINHAVRPAQGVHGTPNGGKSLPLAQRLKHLFYRVDWLRYFGPDYETRINDNVAKWDKLGIITMRDGSPDFAQHGLPERLWVETGLADEFTKSDPTWEQVRIAERLIQAPAEKVAEIPLLAAKKLEAEMEEVPVPARRRILRRDEL